MPGARAAVFSLSFGPAFLLHTSVAQGPRLRCQNMMGCLVFARAALLPSEGGR